MTISARVRYELGEFEPADRILGGYEASQTLSREMATWHPPVRTADADIIPGKARTDARVIDITRNDAYVNSGQELHKDNIVGAHFLLNAAPNTAALGLDEVWETEFTEEVEAKFTLWAESHKHWMDAARRNTLTSMIRLAVGVYLHSGEVLLTSEWDRGRTRRPYRTSFQMIELNRLSNPPTIPPNGRKGRTRGGIEMDAKGAPVAAYIRKALPGPYQYTPMHAHEWSRVRFYNRFGRPLVIHVLEQQRPGQTRGVSQLTAALKEMKTTKQFRDVTLQNAIVNASYAAAIESELPPTQVFEQLGAQTVSETVLDYAAQYLGAVSTYGDAARNMQIDGAKIPHFFPGTKLKMMPMGTPGGVGQDFESSLLRYIAANLGVSFEELAKDYRETNYSSARAGMLGTWKFMQSRKKMVADRIATLIYRNWFEEALNTGQIETMKGRTLPNFYAGLNEEAYVSCTWIGAGRGQIDELKETQAAILRVDARLSTYEDEFGRMGKDWRKQFAQIKRERELMEALGIVPEPQNAINGASGDPREAGDGAEETDRSGGDA